MKICRHPTGAQRILLRRGRKSSAARVRKQGQSSSASTPMPWEIVWATFQITGRRFVNTRHCRAVLYGIGLIKGSANTTRRPDTTMPTVVILEMRSTTGNFVSMGWCSQTGVHTPRSLRRNGFSSPFYSLSQRRISQYRCRLPASICSGKRITRKCIGGWVP